MQTLMIKRENITNQTRRLLMAVAMAALLADAKAAWDMVMMRERGTGLTWVLVGSVLA